MLQNVINRNYKTATIFGEVHVDEHGVVQGLTLEQERALAHVANYVFTEPEKPKAPAKPKTAPKTKAAPKDKEEK